MKLYEIANEYQMLLDQTFDHETGEINETALACLDKVSDDLKNKGVAIASYIQNVEAEEIAIDAAIARMEIRRNQLIKKSSSLINYLQSNMELCGIKEISCPYFVVKLKKCPMSVDIIDESLIPDIYKQTKEITSINKKNIKHALITGHHVNGAQLKQKNRLEIK